MATVQQLLEILEAEESGGVVDRGLTVKSLSRMLGSRPTHIRRWLRELERLGRVESVKLPSIPARWRVVEVSEDRKLPT